MTPSPAKQEEETNEKNGGSRFSDDDVDTEIEVTPEERNADGHKRKRKNKNREKSAGSKDERNSSDERERKRERREKRKAREERNGSPKPPPYDENQDEKKNGKKQEMKTKMNNLLETPLIFACGIFVCVVLPFSIYACDVIISVNVISEEQYRKAVVNPDNDFQQLPSPFQLTGQKYTIHDTLLMTIQLNTRPKKRYSRSISESNGTDVAVDYIYRRILDYNTDSVTATEATSTLVNGVTNSTALNIITTTVPSVTKITTDDGIKTTIIDDVTTFRDVLSEETERTPKPVKVITFPPEPTTGNTSITTETDSPTDVKTTVITLNVTKKVKPTKRPKPSKTPGTTIVPMVTANTTLMDQTPWKRQDGEYCRGLLYFYDHHISYAHKYEQDWYTYETGTSGSKQQALFFLFTIFGFIFLLVGLALRCDIFLSDEWSSFILFNFVLYSISMAITASVFGQESAEGGLRCAMCRFSTNCTDIDPWDYQTHWPADPDNDRWSLVALMSFILKLIDCFTIGIVTLKFVLDIERDLWWVSCLKLFGWVFVFPLLIFTPMLGVIRYQVLPGTSPDDDVAEMVVQVFFYIGVAFWAMCVAALPLFCKQRMCSGKNDEVYDEELGEEY